MENANAKCTVNLTFLAPKCFASGNTKPNYCKFFLLKNRDVFCLLIVRPNSASYLPKRSNSLWHSSTVAWQNKRLSSTNKRWEIQTLCWLDITPLSNQVSSTFLDKVDKPLVHRRNKYDESGSPHFIPLVGVIKPLGSPLIKNE